MNPQITPCYFILNVFFVIVPISTGDCVPESDSHLTYSHRNCRFQTISNQKWTRYIIFGETKKWFKIIA